MTTQLGPRKVREAGTPSPTPKKKLHTSRPNSPPNNMHLIPARERVLTEVIEVHDESMETSPSDREAPVTASHLSYFGARVNTEQFSLENNVQHLSDVRCSVVSAVPVPLAIDYAVYYPAHSTGPPSAAESGALNLTRTSPLQSSTSSMSEIPSGPLRPRNTAPVNLATVRLVQTYTTLTKHFKKMLRKTQQAKKNNYYNVSISEILNNKYEVLSVLGKGSFGQVVKAKLVNHSEEDREALVAIKIIRKSAPFLSQGRQEIRILRLLSTENVDRNNNFLGIVIMSTCDEQLLTISGQ